MKSKLLSLLVIFLTVSNALAQNDGPQWQLRFRFANAPDVVLVVSARTPEAIVKASMDKYNQESGTILGTMDRLMASEATTKNISDSLVTRLETLTNSIASIVRKFGTPEQIDQFKGYADANINAAGKLYDELETLE